ncbi:MAG: DNA-directed RNA polymerase [Candidatus Woesearchaeota archaeon]|jgi:DNA-directed RNA polymerase subunit E'|nr:DNA-directed RNA polymerase [Candidatus Woesearchaeota archaeon]
MFYKTKLKDHIRVPPDLFGLDLQEAVIKRIRKKFEGYIDKDLGVVIDVSNVQDIGEGVIIPGDGASYYSTEFELLVFKPELQEVILGKIKDIADFGAFINLGPLEGMIHVSQTMDDFVSFSKEKTLTGKESKKVLKVADKLRARIIAVSFKDIANPKLGLTMRQPHLGKLDWIYEEDEKKEQDEKDEKDSKDSKDKKGSKSSKGKKDKKK